MPKQEEETLFVKLTQPNEVQKKLLGSLKLTLESLQGLESLKGVRKEKIELFRKIRHKKSKYF